MFLVPVLGVRGQVRTGYQGLVWMLCMLAFALLIGFRYEIGGDWGNYLRHFDNILYWSFSEVLQRGDPAYYAINWLVANAGWSVVWVNLVCAIFIVIGLNSFCRNQPLPWLALLVAVPYLIIVVSMGYSRQAAALGMVLVGLTALGRNQVIKFVFYIFLGALFHKSAVILLPIAALAATRNRIWTFVWIMVVSIVGAYMLVSEEIDVWWVNYVIDEYAFASQGATVRVLMNAVPSVLLFVFRKQIFYDNVERKLWLWLAFFSLLCILGLSYSATAIDRLSLYFIPIQLFAFSRIPFLAADRASFKLIMWSVVIYYGLVMFVWLNFAIHARHWLPYKFSLFY
ncbi:MAG: hypothetical protein ACI9J2_000883 [Saprospiraceae bacterium]|jgi:hypothetical protein